jgi:hypothetical protein
VVAVNKALQLLFHMRAMDSYALEARSGKMWARQRVSMGKLGKVGGMNGLNICTSHLGARRKFYGWWIVCWCMG